MRENKSFLILKKEKSGRNVKNDRKVWKDTGNGTCGLHDRFVSYGIWKRRGEMIRAAGIGKKARKLGLRKSCRIPFRIL